MAADLARPVYRRPVIVPVASSTGFYVGGNVGANWTQDNSTTIASVPAFNNSGALPTGDFRITAGGNGVLANSSRAGFIGGDGYREDRGQLQGTPKPFFRGVAMSSNRTSANHRHR